MKKTWHQKIEFLQLLQKNKLLLLDNMLNIL